MWCLWFCGSPWSGCDVVVVPYTVGEVVAVTVMHILLFLLHVCMLRECEGDVNAGVGSGDGVVAVSTHMGGTRGSGVWSSACDVQEMSVVRGVGRVCDMCISRGGVGGVGGETIVFGVANPGGTLGKWDMCLCFGCDCVGGVRGGVEWLVGQCLGGCAGGVVLCMCVL